MSDLHNASPVEGNDKAEEKKELEITQDEITKRDELVDELRKEETYQQALQEIGNLLKEERWRKVFGSSEDFLPLLLPSLSSSSFDSSFSSALKVFTNFISDNEENRNKVTERVEPGMLLEMLRKSDERDITHHLCALLSNLTNWADNYNVELVKNGAIKDLMKYLDDSVDEQITTLATRILSNMAQSQENREEYRKQFALEKLEELAFKSSHESVRIEAMDAIQSRIKYDPSTIIQFVDRGVLPTLLTSSFSDPSQNLRLSSFELLDALIQHDQVRERFLDNGLLEKVVEASENESDTYIQSVALRVLAVLAVNDRCMRAIFPHYSTFIPLLDSPNREIQLHGLMLISNLARDVDTCQKLVQSGAVRGLTEMVKSEDPRAQNLAVSALRNMAIPDSLKDSVASDDLFKSLVHLLDNSINAPVIFSVVCALKVFLLSGNLLPKFDQHSCLQSVLNIFDRNLSEGQERIYYEAARLLVRLLDVAPERYIDKVMNAKGVKAMEWLLKSPFTLLHSEALRSVIHFLNHINQNPSADHSEWLTLLLASEIPSLLLSIYPNYIHPSDDLKNQSPSPAEVIPSLIQVLLFFAQNDENTRKEMKEKVVREEIFNLYKEAGASNLKELYRLTLQFLCDFTIDSSSPTPKLTLSRPISELKIGEIKMLLQLLNVNFSGFIEKEEFVSKLQTFLS